MSSQHRYWLAAIAVLACSAAIAATKPARRAPATYTVVIDKMTFEAAPVGLHVGDTIIWVNRDLFRHTATAADRSFNVDLAPGKSGAVKLTRPGKIAFVCIFHPGMRGMLTVAP